MLVLFQLFQYFPGSLLHWLLDFQAENQPEKDMWKETNVP